MDDCSSSESLELYIQKLLSSYDYLTTRYGNEIVCSPIELTLTAWPYKYRVQLRHLIHETTKGKESPDAEITDEKELRHTMETLYKIVNYFKKLQRLIFLHNNNKTNEKYPLQKIRSVAKEIIELNLLKIIKQDEYSLQSYLRTIQALLAKIVDSKLSDWYITQLPIFELERQEELSIVLGINQNKN